MNESTLHSSHSTIFSVTDFAEYAFFCLILLSAYYDLATISVLSSLAIVLFCLYVSQAVLLNSNSNTYYFVLCVYKKVEN